MFESLLRLVFVGASGLAASSFVYVTLSTLVQFVRWFHVRRKPWWLRMAQRPRVTSKQAGRSSNPLTRLALPVAVGGLAVKAALTGSFLIAIYLGVIGTVLYLYLEQQSSSQAHEKITGAIGDLVAAYYSSYLVVPTVFGALMEAGKTISNLQLQAAVQRALDAFSAGRTTEEALDQLVADIGDPYVAQFAFILRHTSESNQTEILAALQSLGKTLGPAETLARSFARRAGAGEWQRFAFFSRRMERSLRWRSSRPSGGTIMPLRYLTRRS